MYFTYILELHTLLNKVSKINIQKDKQKILRQKDIKSLGIVDYNPTTSIQSTLLWGRERMEEII